MTGRSFPDLAKWARFGRMLRMLARSRAPWFYGMFRTTPLRETFGLSVEFDRPWSGDYITLLPFILADRVRGTNKTEFYCRTSGQGDHANRPRRMAARIRFAQGSLEFNLRILRASALSPTEKIFCLPLLMRHTHRATSWNLIKRLRRRL